MARLVLLLVAGALGWSPRTAPSRRIFLERLRYPAAALATMSPLRTLAVDPNVTSLQARALVSKFELQARTLVSTITLTPSRRVGAVRVSGDGARVPGHKLWR